MKGVDRKSNELARECISSILLFEMSDPRLQFVTITSVKVSFDKSYADVYFSCDPEDYETVLALLNNAKGRIKSLLAGRLKWRRSPELRFHIDDVLDVANSLEHALIEESKRWKNVCEDSETRATHDME